MKKIVVPIDFSDASRNASEYAVRLAKIFNAEVELMHVYKELIPATVGPEPWTVRVSPAFARNEKLINDEVDFLKRKYNVEIKSIIKKGFKSESISDEIKEAEADLVVMGKREEGNKIIGNTILKTIRKSAVPVLIVPEKVQFKPFDNIALAIDFEQTVNSSCLDILYSLYEKFHSSLRVLHVEQRANDLKASEVPEKLKFGFVLSRFTYLYDRVEFNDIDKGIQKFVEDHPTDLLAIVAHHHNLLERSFGTIHSQYLSFELRCPLLVLKNL